ncbi:LIM domain only protein 3-like isoform X1 [Varroa destructor]|uniref:LIM zinc-binding domain-containing protein n=1 Tax=Varroa destructor TaxID=109461 RepID=A0A7M7KAR9_VARDE|nr:LIM domain only protein 3-like isoform X1 [Varroa destructor]
MGSCEASSTAVGPIAWSPCPDVHATTAEPSMANLAQQRASYSHQAGQVSATVPAAMTRKTKSGSRRAPGFEAPRNIPSLASNGNATSLPIAPETSNNNSDMSNKSTQQQQVRGAALECAGCQQSIRERYLLCALDRSWHEGCLKCSHCNCLLGEVGSTLFFKENRILCRRDYLRLYGSSGRCSACQKEIPAFEMVMRAGANVYHLECFACQQCRHRFCVGDRFYVQYGQILCEEDRYTPAEL